MSSAGAQAPEAVHRPVATASSLASHPDRSVGSRKATTDRCGVRRDRPPFLNPYLNFKLPSQVAVAIPSQPRPTSRAPGIATARRSFGNSQPARGQCRDGLRYPRESGRREQFVKARLLAGRARQKRPLRIPARFAESLHGIQKSDSRKMTASIGIGSEAMASPLGASCHKLASDRSATPACTSVSWRAARAPAVPESPSSPRRD